EAVGRFFVERYGSAEAIKRTLATDPIGSAADVSMLLTGGGGIAARAPGVAGRLDEVAGAVGRSIDPINAGAAGVKAGAYAGNVVSGGRFAPTATAKADIARALERDSVTPQG